MIKDIEQMFTNFVHAGQQPRHAENADARLDIRRQDPDEKRRKGEKEEDSKDPLEQEDKTSVSLSALQAFLKNFLKSLEDSPSEQKNDASPAHISKALNAQAKAPHSQKATKAQNAYATAARTTTPENDFSAKEAQKAASSLGLSSEEVRTIHTLLEDLEALSKQGIINLEIQRSSTFLQSLVSAVEKTKEPN